jgi:N-formylmaleamate deformylase
MRFLSTDAIADLADVPARSRWFRSGGIRLHALDYENDRRALIILPGITSPAITMDFVARHLTDLVHPIILDIRGRGFSDSATRYELSDYVEDVGALVAALRISDPIVLGHSMGARIAALYAHQSPELVPSVIVDPPVSGPGRAPYPTPIATFDAQLDEAVRGTDADGVKAWWPNWPPSELALRARWLASCDAKAIADSHKGFESDDFFTVWTTLASPTVLLHGDKSAVFNSEATAEAVLTNPRATVESVPDAGHMVFWDNPIAARAATRTAVERLMRQSS